MKLSPSNSLFRPFKGSPLRSRSPGRIRDTKERRAEPKAARKAAPKKPAAKLEPKKPAKLAKRAVKPKP